MTPRYYVKLMGRYYCICNSYTVKHIIAKYCQYINDFTDLSIRRNSDAAVHTRTEPGMQHEDSVYF